MLARLDNEVIFKKVFTNNLVFTHFVKDILGIEIEIELIQTDKRFKFKSPNIDFAYDVFAESKDKKVVVGIQRIDMDSNFDYFLHHYTMTIAQLQRTTQDKLEQNIHSILIITAPYVTKGKQDHLLQDDVLILQLNPRNLDGHIINIYEHKLVFLNPNYRDENTPANYADWLDLASESISNPEAPNINVKNEAIQQASELMQEENLTPKERKAAQIAATQAITLKLHKEKGKKEGKAEGKMEAKREMVKNMKAKGFETNLIAEMTGLDIETIDEID